MVNNPWLNLEEYELAYHVEQFQHPMRYTRATSQVLAQLAPRIARGSVLDVGAGAGGALWWLAEQHPACTFYGVELNDALVTVGRKELLSRGSSVVLAPGDSMRLEYEDDAFDVVLSQQLLSWVSVEDAALMLSEQMRVARVAVVSVALFTDRHGDYLTTVVDRDSGKTKACNVYGLDAMEAFASKHGWELARHERFVMDWELEDAGRVRDVRTVRTHAGELLAFAGETYMPWQIVVFERGLNE